MNKKIKFAAALFMAVFLTACALSKKIESGRMIKTKDAMIYQGKTFDTGTKQLVYVLMPGDSTEPFIRLWQGYADRQGALVAVPFNWDRNTMAESISALEAEYGISKVVITGFSNGGYNACGFGLAYPDQVAAIVPMGAYCRTGDINGPTDVKPPILAVAGAMDDWALGEEGDFLTDANADLVQLGYRAEAIIVPGLGHSLPFTAMGEVEEWLKI